MVNTQYLGSSSQQGETIEVRHRAMASCKESSTFPLLTMEEFIQSRICSGHFDRSAHRIVTEATIVTVDFPSQVYEGNRDSLSNSESPSPLQGGTFLDPPRDFSLATSAGESERQLIVSTAEAIQYTHSTELVDAI